MEVHIVIFFKYVVSYQVRGYQYSPKKRIRCVIKVQGEAGGAGYEE